MRGGPRSCRGDAGGLSELWRDRHEHPTRLVGFVSVCASCSPCRRCGTEARARSSSCSWNPGFSRARWLHPAEAGIPGAHRHSALPFSAQRRPPAAGGFRPDVRSAMSVARDGRVMTTLVIVESPAKAKTIAKISRARLRVQASMGHVRDLPKSKLGVDVEHDFAPQYLVPRKGDDQGAEGRRRRTPTQSTWRPTPTARARRSPGTWSRRSDSERSSRSTASTSTRSPATRCRTRWPTRAQIDMHLVDAQQARRVLDRLVGYKISPLLWEKVRRGLSAGRVQTVALRLIVEREREIEAFVPVEYWTIEADAGAGAGRPRRRRISARGCIEHRRRRRPSCTTGGRRTRSLADLNGRELRRARGDDAARRSAAAAPPSPPAPSSRRRRASSASPAGARCRWPRSSTRASISARRGTVGLITYMRTDSTNVAHERAGRGAGACIAQTLRRRRTARRAAASTRARRRARRRRTRRSARPIASATPDER